MGRTVNPLAFAYGGSNPSLPTNLFSMSKDNALVAQLAEHTLGKGEVSGSNPLMSSTTVKADMQISAFILVLDICSVGDVGDG